ncbi:unnamed protein product, partial [Prorocentrum cordatum]
HGQLNTLTKYTVANQCPSRASTFACRRTAINHITAAYRHGRCMAQKSTFNFPVVIPQQFVCPEESVHSSLAHSNIYSNTYPRHAFLSRLRMSWLQALPAAEEDHAPVQKQRRRGQRGSSAQVANGGGGSQGPMKKDPNIVDLSDLDNETCDVKQMQKFFPVMMRLILNLAMSQRQLESIELKTFLMSSGAQVAVKARARVRAWIKAAEEARTTLAKEDAEKKIKEMGTISVACYAGVFEGLAAEGNAVGRTNQQQLDELSKQPNQLTHVEMGEAVPLAKITDAHEDGKVKLVLSFTSRLNFAPVLASLVQAVAEYKQGTAPMGHLERLLHTGLQEFESMMQE